MTLTLPLVTSTVISPEVAVIVLPFAVIGIFMGALIVPLVRLIAVTLLIVGLVPVPSIVKFLSAVTLKVALPALIVALVAVVGRVAITPSTVMLVSAESSLSWVRVAAVPDLVSVPYLTALALSVGMFTTYKSLPVVLSMVKLPSICRIAFQSSPVKLETSTESLILGLRLVPSINPIAVRV